MSAINGAMPGRVANPHRGEVAVTLKTNEGRRPFIMRATFEAILEIEQTTGTQIVPLAAALRNRDLGLHTMTAIVTAGLKAAGEPATFERVAAMVYDTGMLDGGLLDAVNDFIVAALTGGEVADEDKDAAAEKKSTEAADAA